MVVELDARRGPLETEVAGELLAGVSEQVLVELWRRRKARRAQVALEYLWITASHLLVLCIFGTCGTVLVFNLPNRYLLILHLASTLKADVVQQLFLFSTREITQVAFVVFSSLIDVTFFLLINARCRFL